MKMYKKNEPTVSLVYYKHFIYIYQYYIIIIIYNSQNLNAFIFPVANNATICIAYF